MIRDCIIIGGGIAGIQAAIQLGRYQHDVLVIDALEKGRSNLCRCYHNVLGWPEGVSGPELREIGTEQAKKLGVHFMDDKVERVNKRNGMFHVDLNCGEQLQAKRILFATGVKDRIPPFKNIYPCLGISIYVCPDCDGYEIKDKKTLVLGSGDVGANMALTLTFWSEDLIYINHEQEQVSETLFTKLRNKGISYYNEPIKQVLTDDSFVKGVILENDTKIKADHAFIAFGGNEVHSDLAKDLGVTLHKNKHIIVNPRTQMTDVEHVWAAGDVVAHSEQVTIAMGDGMQAAIWIHKTLM